LKLRIFCSALIMISLILMSTFLPCVKASPEILLSSEFKDPLGEEASWSFEGRKYEEYPDPYGSGSPPHGVYACPPWETNNGGWRECLGDVNGDGKTRVDDVMAVSLAFGSEYGDPDWDDVKDCDINGDGKVRVDDIGLAAGDFGNDAECVDGSYSWYTNGGENYQMWRNVKESCIDAIKGRTVMFGYWFLPESLQSYSSSPGAWSESLSPPEGVWSSGTGTGNVYLCSDQKVEGSYSIEHRTEGLDYWGCLVFTLHDDMEVDTNVFTLLAFYIRLESNFDFIRVELHDYAGMVVRRYVDGLRSNEWIGLTLGMGDAYSEDWEHCLSNTQPFDWSEVKTILCYANFEGTGTGSFWIDVPYLLKPMPARAEIQYYYGNENNETIYGDWFVPVWIAPNGIDWWNAYVNANLPSDTTEVKVIVHGSSDFKAYIDSASFRVFNCVTESSDKGKLTLGVSVYDWRKIQGFDPDGDVSLIPALYAEAIGDYKIISTELKVELLPNDGSSTNQDGFLNIYYCAQENNEGHEIDPAEQEEVQSQTLEATIFLIKAGTAVAIGFALGAITGGAGAATTPLWLTVLVGTGATTAAGTIEEHTLRQFASDPDDKHAEWGTDYFVYEHWGYPTISINTGPFVESAAGQYSLGWAFRTNSQTTPFQIKITATVTWGEISAIIDPLFGAIFFLKNVGSTSISNTVTIVP